MFRIWFLVAVALSAGLLLFAGYQSRKDAPPNVLLISIDSLRADHLGSYGYERDTSPVLDKLAQEGTRFDTAIAPSSWTLPSHMTLFTGQHPAVHGVRFKEQVLSESVPTVTEILKDQGYETGGFVGGPFLHRLYGYDRGFDVYDDQLAAVGHLRSHEGITSPQLIQKLLDWLQSRRSILGAPPFFAFLHLWDVHYDFIPPPPYDEMFNPDYEGPVDGTNMPEAAIGLAGEDLNHLVALYDGEIRFTDHALGGLFAALREMGLFDSTLIIVTADHGESFMEHGTFGHSKEIFDESIRVPLIFHLPERVAAGRVVEEQVRLMDIAPTIASLVTGSAGTVGMPPDSPQQALDLSPWLDVGKEPQEPPLTLAFPEARWNIVRGVRTDNGKLIRNAMQPKKVQVFDLAQDPAESASVAENGSKAELLEELLLLEKEWAEWTATLQRTDKTFTLPSALEARLESLGYIEQDPSSE